MTVFVQDLLNNKGREVITVGPNAVVGDIANILHLNSIGGVVVVSDDYKILGIFTERDFVRTVAARPIDALITPVKDVMTTNVICCQQTSTLNQIMVWMTSGRFRHMPVEEKGYLVGIISIGDVVKARMNEIQAEADSIKAYVTG